ncbi:MAG: hypothetical protein V4857_25355 [Pseudomonadota bacterium]
MYLFIVVGLGTFVWPGIIQQAKPWELMEGIVVCMLAAFSVLSALGLRYPLQMLPILLWELVWKVLWLLIVALPLWRSDRMDAATMANTVACIFVVLVPFVIPWRYVFENYLKKAGDPWARRAAQQAPAASN